MDRVQVCWRETVFQVHGKMYSHHQKTIILDSGPHEARVLTSFVGGLDLTDGRWDTPSHFLFGSLQNDHKNDFYQKCWKVSLWLKITLWDSSFSWWSIINNSSTSSNKCNLKCCKDLILSMSCLSGRSNLSSMKEEFDGEDETSKLSSSHGFMSMKMKLYMYDFWDCSQELIWYDLNVLMLKQFVPKSGGPRQPWHDLHCKIEGPAAYDVLTNFEQRWRKATKKHEDMLLDIHRHDNLRGPSNRAPSDGDPDLFLSDDKDPETWHVQVGFHNILENLIL